MRTLRWLIVGSIAVAFALAAWRGVGPDPSADLPAPPFGPVGVADPPAWPAPRVVLLVIIDTLRADHVGAYGAASGSTPALDRLAGTSFVFDQAAATSSWTRSSIASILTSRYPGSLHVLGRNDAIAADALTVAEAVAARGWRTAGVFSNGNASPELGFAQGVTDVRTPRLVRGYPGDFQKFTAEGVTAEAIAALRAWHDGGERAPLFLFVHYIDPHGPYLPHPELMPEPEPPGRFSGARPDLDRLDRTWASRLIPADLARIKHLYEGEVRYCDRWVGRLLDALGALGVADRTLVMVTADHGEGLWDHGRRGHGVDLYQEQIHVPLIVHYPGMTAADAARVAEPVSLLDLAPTILAASGIERPGAFEGHDLTPLTRGRARPSALGYVYAEMDLDGRSFESMRVGTSKLIRRRSGWRALLKADELYRLDVDPGERDDLSRGDRALVRRLLAATDRWDAAIAARRGNHPTMPLRSLSPELHEQLRGLGYVR